MKKALILAACMFAVSCGGTQQDPVTFKLVQPAGQKSVYSMKNDLKVEAMSLEVDRGSQSSEVVMNAMLETEVTDSQPGGNWTLSSKFTSMDMKINQQPAGEATGTIVGKTFSVILDNAGRVIDVKGMENVLPGMDLKQMMTQLSPSVQLPARPVRVGESWPIELTTPLDAPGGKIDQKMQGTGTLKEVTGGHAVIDFDYTLQVAMTDSGQSKISMSGTGKGKTTARYDLEKARFVSNKTEMTMETTGRMAMGDRTESVKNILNSSLQMNLIDK